MGVLLPERGIAQVSMNLTDCEQTSPRVAFERVREEAGKRGVAVLESEIIGLVPEAALADTTPEALLLDRLHAGSDPGASVGGGGSGRDRRRPTG